MQYFHDSDNTASKVSAPTVGSYCDVHEFSKLYIHGNSRFSVLQEQIQCSPSHSWRTLASRGGPPEAGSAQSRLVPRWRASSAANSKESQHSYLAWNLLLPLRMSCSCMHNCATKWWQRDQISSSYYDSKIRLIPSHSWHCRAWTDDRFQLAGWSCLLLWSKS